MTNTITDAEIDRARQTPLVLYFERRGVEFKRAGGNLVARCPYHDEQTASFTIHGDDDHAHCYGCGWHGDVIKAEMTFTGSSFPDAVQQLTGSTLTASTLPKTPKPSRRSPEPKPEFPADMHGGTDADWRALAELRNVSLAAVSLASKMGVLRFGKFHDDYCWIVTDGRRRTADRRRLDGQPFADGKKGKAIPGTKRDWIVGLEPDGLSVDDFDTLLVCEGAPDLLAAFHFIERAMARDSAFASSYRTLPVSILGCGTKHLHGDALALCEGKRVRLYPHIGDKGSGLRGAAGWAASLADAGATNVDWFDFRKLAGVASTDGRPVQDLNDCTWITENHAHQLEGLLP